MSDDRSTRVDVRLKRALESGTLPRQLLLDGPAGTGKTLGVLRILHTIAADYPGVRILICRQTRVSLTESVLVTFEQEILPSDGMERIASRVSRRNRQAYQYPSGSTIVLGGLDKPDRILSTAWDIIYVNEAIEVEESAWDALAGRLRRPGRPLWLGYLIGDTNPGDPGHWLKVRADEGRLALWSTGHEANPAMHDGRGWTAAGLAYLESLGKLRGTRRRRFLDGIWAAGEGQWFEAFDPARHVSPLAEYDPAYDVHLSVDTGVHTGAAWWQVRGEGEDAVLCVFGDYYSYNVPAHANGLAIVRAGHALTGSRAPDVGRMDPSGNANNGTGLVIGQEFRRAGLDLKPWPKYPGSPASGLALLESFISTDSPRFLVHPRCKATVAALANYRRKKRGNQYIDEPEDPQHPHEELIDALRSGLLDRFPGGRKLPWHGVGRSAGAISH